MTIGFASSSYQCWHYSLGNQGPLSGGPSKRKMVDKVSITSPSIVESPPCFPIYEGMCLWREKYFNPQALIQAPMLSQFDRDMLRKVGPHASMDFIPHFTERS